MAVPPAVGFSLSVPLVACVPLQAPLAVQEVALVDDHVKVALCPAPMVVGATAMVTVGAGEDVVVVIFRM